MDSEGLKIQAFLDGLYGPENVLNPQQLEEQYEVIGYEYPYVAVRRKRDGIIGSFLYSPSRLFYFGWEEYEK